MPEVYDVAIIGTGTAGLSALREIRKRTENFVIVNAGPYGTTCARVGCMPSKLLIESANHFHRRRSLEAFGIHGAEQLRIDVPAVLRRVRRLRDEFVAGIVDLTEGLGARNVAGRARFLAPDELAIGERRLRARSIIIATGSRPIVPREWQGLGGNKRIFTSDDLFEQQDFPGRMAVIGLGALGIEMAQSLARLGVAVTAFGSGQHIGGLTDPVVSEQALALLRREFDIELGLRAAPRAEHDGLHVPTDSRDCVVDAVVAALGRQPNINGLGLENLGVPLDPQGLPPINPATMQIAGLPVYFAGDVTSDLPVLHVANDEGHIAGYNALLPEPVCFRRRVPLAIIFSDPNIAMVGARLADLDAAELAIGSIDFSNQGRARVAAENHGVLRVYADKRDGLLRGAEMCSPRAEHLAQLLALAIDQRATVHSLLRMPFYHPVFEEGLHTALRDASRQLDFTVGSDLASCDAVGASALD